MFDSYTDDKYANAKERLEYLRGEIKAERISTGEILELQSLADFIPLNDVVLREWAGISEFDESDEARELEADNDEYLREQHESNEDNKL